VWKQALKLSARHTVDIVMLGVQTIIESVGSCSPLLLFSHGIFSETKLRIHCCILAAATALLEAITSLGRPTLQSILLL